MQIPFHKTHITNQEIEEVVKVLKSGWITMGPKTIEFENKFKEYIGSKNAISCNSATAALHLSLKAIGLKKNEEIIVPTNTFIATAEVVTYFDAIPVLCDIEKNTHNIDVSKIETLITKKTKAIIPVHFAGQPCDMNKIFEIAKKYNLKIIEDAAHALPAFYKNKKIGTLSDITCFSFYATKTLSTGEGGMAVTNNKQYMNSIKRNRLHGIDKDAWNRCNEIGSWYYEVVDNGFKYNATDIASALGLIQLKKLEKMQDARCKIAKKYTKAFKNSVVKTPYIKKDRQSSWHLYVIKVNNRNELIEILKKKQIGTSVHFIPVHKHPYYKKKYNYKNSTYPIANQVFEKSLSLPIYPNLKDDEIDYIIKNIKKYAK